MKRFVKGVMGAAWRSTGAVRRPLIGTLDRSIETIVTRVVTEVVIRTIETEVTPCLARLESAVRGSEEATHRGNLLVHEVRQDIDLVLDSLVREVVRLQMQVEVLEQATREAYRLEAVGSGDDPSS